MFLGKGKNDSKVDCMFLNLDKLIKQFPELRNWSPPSLFFWAQYLIHFLKTLNELVK